MSQEISSKKPETGLKKEKKCRVYRIIKYVYRIIKNVYRIIKKKK